MKHLSLFFVTVLFLSEILAASVGQVVHVKGDVQVVPASGQPKAAKPKTALSAGDSLRTGANSLVVFSIDNRVTHKLEAGSEFKITAPIKKGIVELIKGSLFSLVKKQKTKKTSTHYRVKTKAAVAGVRGTEFFLSYGSEKKQDDTWLCVNEGTVEVLSNSGGRPVLVKQGFGVSVSGAKISKPAPLPWTKKLNWNLDPKKGSLKNEVSIEEAYKDLLDVDYD